VLDVRDGFAAKPEALVRGRFGRVEVRAEPLAQRRIFGELVAAEALVQEARVAEDAGGLARVLEAAVVPAPPRSRQASMRSSRTTRQRSGDLITTPFHPWHALEMHRPLGDMMRARDPAYLVSSSPKWMLLFLCNASVPAGTL
jgi:hypothetical protein